MEVVGGAFLSSALNVLFDRLAPEGDLLNMFKMDKRDVRLLKKLRMTLIGLQAVLSDAENKQTSNQFVSQWLNEFRHAVDSAENLMEEVNYGSDEEIQHWELPSSIKRLEVWNLKTLSSQVLKSLTSLQYLYFEGNLPQIQSLLEQGGLPSSLSELHLWNHDELHSPHLCHVTSLLNLHFLSCRNLQSLSESTLPSSLSQLTIESCDNLQSLSESALPSSLSQLTIMDCPELQSLSEFALPSSLSQLTIESCDNLQSLSEFALPSSLSQLTIESCHNLQSLPVKGMPSSLSKLYIRNCSLLTPLLEFDKGKYWPNIAHIPIIQIDWKYM